MQIYFLRWCDPNLTFYHMCDVSHGYHTKKNISANVIGSKEPGKFKFQITLNFNVWRELPATNRESLQRVFYSLNLQGNFFFYPHSQTYPLHLWLNTFSQLQALALSQYCLYIDRIVLRNG